MDLKPDSQKNLIDNFDDSLKCSDCKDLEEHKNKNCYKQLIKRSMDSSDTDTSAGADEQNKRQCYRCENCFLYFTGSHKLEDHIKHNCLSMPVVSKSETSYESSIESLRLLMVNEKDSFDALRNAREKAREAVRRLTEAMEQKRYAQKLYKNAVVRERNMSTVVSREEELIIVNIRKQSHEKLQAVSNEVQVLRKSVNKALQKLKYYNQVNTSTASKVHCAFSEAIKACQEKITSASLFQEADKELTRIRDTLELRHNTLKEVQNSVDGLEQAILVMEKNDSQIWESGSPMNESDTDTIDNVVKEESTDFDDQMDVAMEDLDDQRPSTSRAHKSEQDLMSEKITNVSCARRLSFS